MEMEFSGNKIAIDKILSSLDELVIEFAKILDRHKVNYVIISGYIPILFGRSRETEDIDMFIEDMDYLRFEVFWNSLEEAGFECINAENPKDAFENYLKEKIGIRFAEKGKFIPNFELKFPKTRYNIYSLKNKVEVILNGQKLNTSQLEMQIAFKLELGSEKDFEDARHLYNIFREHLDIGLLRSHISELRVEKEAEEILWRRSG